MKTNFRLLLGVTLALFTVTGAIAQKLSPVGISVTPGSALPGDKVSISITANNSDTSQFGPGGTVDISVTFTSTTTGSQFTTSATGVAPTAGFIGKATVDPVSGQVTPGVGTFTFSTTLPTQTLEGGTYSAQVTLSNPAGGSIQTPTFSVTTTVLTVTGQPDLLITNLTYPAGTSYIGGNVIPMSITYINKSSTKGTYNIPFLPSTNKSNKPVRIQIVLSSNPTYGDADDFQLTFFDITAKVNADDAPHTLTWNQLLPGNFSGSYYVLAKIDSLNVVDETGEAAAAPLDPNVWLDVSGTKIGLQPSAFPTLYVPSMASGVTAAGYSDNPAVSSDGRYTVFASDAANLVGGDTNAVRDVFIYDNQTSVVRRVSASQQGQQANGASNNPAISADGRFVAFASDATNLVFGDFNGFTDIFVVDVITGTITRESVSTAGGDANGPSFRPALSSDGRYLVFESTATNLVSSVTPSGITQIYRRDRTTGVTVLISQSSGGTAGNGTSLQAALSGDGNYVAFASDATNLVSGDTNGVRDVFLRDVAGATTTRVSVATGAVQATGGASRTPAISSDGRYIAFASDATNLVPNDTNGTTDVFVYNRVAGTTTRMSVSSSGAQGVDATDPTVTGSALGSFNPTISSDGRYVAFASLANNLAPGDNIGQYNLNGSGNGAVNIYVMDRDTAATGTYDTPGNIKTTNVSLNRFGYQAYYVLNVESTAAADIQPSISGDGRWVAFPTDAESAPGLIHGATNQLSPDNNNARDIILYDRRINALPNPSTLPTVSITSPTNGGTYPVNSPVSVIANAATTIGSVASVQFFVNGASVGGPITAFPYVTSWTPKGTGRYTLSALVTDSFGNQGVSGNITVTVGPPAPPTISITSPVSGSTVTINTAQTLAADASSPNGSIVSVQFFVNGSAVGSPVLTSPYTASWTPTSAGVYTITASALDNGGTSTTASPVTVMAVPTAIATNTEYSGNYAGGAEAGRFTLVTIGGKSGSLTAYSTSSSSHVYFFPSLTLSSSGAFTGVDSTGQVTIMGNINDTGVSGTIDGGRLTFIGPIVTATTTGSTGLAGSYEGSIVGNGASTVSAIVGADRSITATVSDGTSLDAGMSAIDSSGAFTVTLASGNKITGTLDPVTNFIIATLSGSKTGTIAAALASGPAFSDGVLRNLSTRGQVGIGANVLIAGFFISGTAPKNVLIRAVGPSLSTFGLTSGLLADPQLTLNYASGPSSGATIAFNDNWGGDPAISSTAARVGAFPIDPTTRESALLVQLNPGAYTAIVNGANATSGLALVEIYDADTLAPFTAQKALNVSTRGQVGAGQSQLIAGFVISGTIPKRVLIRGVGPSLTKVGLTTGYVTDPSLRLSHAVNNVDTLIRENDNWQQGNDAAMVTAASTSVGAFALDSGSKDAVILITLPPGSYTAQVSGVNNATGLALVEVYEVP